MPIERNPHTSRRSSSLGQSTRASSRQLDDSPHEVDRNQGQDDDDQNRDDRHSVSFLVGHWWEPLPSGASANPQAHANRQGQLAVRQLRTGRPCADFRSRLSEAESVALVISRSRRLRSLRPVFAPFPGVAAASGALPSRPPAGGRPLPPATCGRPRGPRRGARRSCGC